MPHPKTPRQHATDLRTEAQRLEDLARQFRGAAYKLDPRGRRPKGTAQAKVPVSHR